MNQTASSLRDEIKTVIDILPENCLSTVLDFMLFEHSRHVQPNRRFDEETIEAMNDVLLERNLHGPYKTAKEAVATMLED